MKRSRSRAYEAIGVGSPARISSVLAEPPRSRSARTGGITERYAQAYLGPPAGRSGAARRRQPQVVYLARARTGYSRLRASAGTSGERLAVGRGRTRTLIFARAQAAASRRDVFATDDQPGLATASHSTWHDRGVRR